MRRIYAPNANVVGQTILFHRGCYGYSKLTAELSEVDAVARAQSGRTTYGQTSEEIHKWKWKLKEESYLTCSLK